MTPFLPGESRDAAAFRFVRAREHAATVETIASELDAAASAIAMLVGDDGHIPPRVAALRAAVASLAAEVAQVVRDAERRGWTPPPAD